MGIVKVVFAVVLIAIMIISFFDAMSEKDKWPQVALVMLSAMFEMLLIN